MRIIAGKFKGKVLKEFELGSTRPTTDMVREALFDKIGFDVDGAVFLDLFAGTGAVGIEALSRNAKFCFFVDAQKDAIKIINKNLELVGARNFELKNLDFETALLGFEKSSTKFDIVFLDPPYASDFAEKAIDAIMSKNLLSQNGLIVWEHDASKLEYIQQNFADCKTKKYGKKYLTYIK